MFSDFEKEYLKINHMKDFAKIKEITNKHESLLTK